MHMKINLPLLLLVLGLAAPLCAAVPGPQQNGIQVNGAGNVTSPSVVNFDANHTLKVLTLPVYGINGTPSNGQVPVWNGTGNIAGWGGVANGSWSGVNNTLAIFDGAGNTATLGGTNNTVLFIGPTGTLTFSGTLPAAVQQNITQVGNLTGPLQVNAANLTTNSTNGLLLFNPTAANGSVAAQWSPRLNLTGAAWNGSASLAESWIAEVQSVSGNDSALIWSYREGSAGNYTPEFVFYPSLGQGAASNQNPWGQIYADSFFGNQFIQAGNATNANATPTSIVISNDSTGTVLTIVNMRSPTTVFAIDALQGNAYLLGGNNTPTLLTINTTNGALTLNNTLKAGGNVDLAGFTVTNGSFNGTMSGGTLSGTIAGSPTVSGNPNFTGAPTRTTPSIGDVSANLATTQSVPFVEEAANVFAVDLGSNASLTATCTGTGSVAFTYNQWVECNTGTTANSTALAGHYIAFLETGLSFSSINWSKNITFSVNESVFTSSPNDSARIYFGNSSTSITTFGNLSGNGFGWEIDNNNLYGAFYNGTYNTVNLSTVSTTAAGYNLIVNSDGTGNITWYVNGVAKGTTSTGPTGGTTTANFVIENSNGADTTNDRLFLSQIKFYVQP